MTEPRRPRWELKGPWVFEPRDDGTILFYPHGWGRGYVVPTKQKRREIEAFLRLWRRRLGRARGFAQPAGRWLAVPASIICAAILLALFPSPYCRILWYVLEWPTLVRTLLAAMWLWLAVLLGMPLALLFAAETAKADLEKADTRRSFIETQRSHVRRVGWALPCALGACGALAMAEGIWFSLPKQESVMRPAHVIPVFLRVGVLEIVLGLILVLVALWQIRVLKSARPSHMRADPRTQR